MRKRWLTLPVLLLFLFGSLPVEAQQLQNPNVSTPTTLYFHIFDTFNQFPINTQPQQVESFEVGGTNFPTLEHQIPGQHPLGPYGPYDFNTIYGWSTSGPVEYDFIENGRPRFHPERGIAADVKLDSSVQPVVYLYAELRDFAGTQLGPQFMPQYTFRVTVREGNAVGDTEQLNNGAPIMAGQVTYHLMDGQAAAAANDAVSGQSTPDGVTVLTPDPGGIFEFAIPLTLAQNTIPKRDAFNVRIDWYQNIGGAMGDDTFAEGWLRLVMDNDHRPRMEMNIMNPVYVEFVHPQVAAGTLLIHTGVNSPWGTYDVDVANMTVEVTGPSKPATLKQVVSQNQHVHGLHDRAAEVTYLWKFRDENAKNGDYSIKVTVPNKAGTQTASATAGFKVEGKKAFGIDEGGQTVAPVDEGGGKKGSPSVALPLFGIALLDRERHACRLLRRRQQDRRRHHHGPVAARQGQRRHCRPAHR
jgi:hypothetical protein